MSVREALKMTYQPTAMVAAIGSGTTSIWPKSGQRWNVWRVKAIFCLGHVANRSWADEGGHFTN